MQGKIKNLDKSNLDRRFLKVIEFGAQTIFSGREFQGEMTRYAKELLFKTLSNKYINFSHGNSNTIRVTSSRGGI